MIKLKRDEFEYVMYNKDCVIIDTSIKGRCIIANRDYKKGEIMCINPILMVERSAMSSILRRYVFCPRNTLSADPDKVVVMLGIGFLFCHSDNANLDYVFDFRKRTVTFTTVRDIPRGYELTDNYHTPMLWFDAVDDVDLTEHLQNLDKEVFKPTDSEYLVSSNDGGIGD